MGSQGRFEDNMAQRYGNRLQDAVESAAIAWETNGGTGPQGGQGVPVRGGYGGTFGDVYHENSRKQGNYEYPVGTLKGVSQPQGRYQYGMTLRPALRQWPQRYVQVNGQVRKLGNYTTRNVGEMGNVGKMSEHFENGKRRG